MPRFGSRVFLIPICHFSKPVKRNVQPRPAIPPVTQKLRVIDWVFLFWFWRDSHPVGQGLLIHEVSRSHTTTHHSR